MRHAVRLQTLRMSKRKFHLDSSHSANLMYAARRYMGSNTLPTAINMYRIQFYAK